MIASAIPAQASEPPGRGGSMRAPSSGQPGNRLGSMTKPTTSNPLARIIQSDTGSGSESSRGLKGDTDTGKETSDKETTSDSYADAANKNRWKEPQRRKKRKASRSGSESDIPDLSGFEDEPNKEIFVRDLAYAKCRKPADLEKMVKKYCNVRGVDILFAKTYLLRFSNDKANCRVKVKVCDVDKVLSDDFWPRCVKARPWLTNAEFNAGKDKDGSDGELFSD